MNKRLGVFSLLIYLTLVSCATTVKITVNHPPLVDMRKFETITVIPLEWKDNEKYSYLASHVSSALTAGVKKAKAYDFIEAAVLKSVGKSGYWEYVDVYVDGDILNITTNEETELREEKDGEKTKTTEYITRTVIVNIEYRYISAIDGSILRSFNKTAQTATTFSNAERSSKWWVELLLNIFVPKGKSFEQLARSAVRQFSSGMNNELNAYITIESRKIMESTSKNTAFKDAQKLVRQKKYFDALTLYRIIYEQSGSVVAGYNRAILLEVNNQYLEALELLEELDERHSIQDMATPYFIKIEMGRLNEIIDNLIILEDYTY